MIYKERYISCPDLQWAFLSVITLIKLGLVRLVCLFMSHIVIFFHEFFTALQLLKHCCYIIGTQTSASASKHCKSSDHWYGQKAYISYYSYSLQLRSLIWTMNNFKVLLYNFSYNNFRTQKYSASAIKTLQVI